MTHQDVAVVIAERLRRLAKIARRALDTGKMVSVWSADPATLDEAAKALESQAKALSEAEAERDAWRDRESETQEALQAIGDEFGIYGGEKRTDGVRRILTEQQASLAEARRVIEQCRDALSRCYNVTEWPADGSTSQDEALTAARDFINAKEKTHAMD